MTTEEALGIVDALLQERSLSNIQEQVFRQVWQGQAYAKIAETSGYDVDYITHVGAQLWKLLTKAAGEKVTKCNVRSVLRQWQLQQIQTATVREMGRWVAREWGSEGAAENYTPTPHCSDPKLAPAINPNQDWGEAIDVSAFYGRTAELATLERWIVTDHCRLITVLGMGGIGKTVLAVKLAQQVQGEFEYLIWRSLRNAPLFRDLLVDLIQLLFNQPQLDLPVTIDGQIMRLLKHLRSHRCLLVLDNAESILRSGASVGYYQEGYEGYGQLLRCAADTIHQSCLVLTSREQLRGLAANEGDTSPVRSIRLTGLDETTGQRILNRKYLSGSDDDQRKLIECYRGNPLALKIVATSIQALFEGDITEFLAQGTTVFNGIRDLLDQQCDRLSALEKQIMYWLATHREPVSVSALQAEIVPPVSKSKLLEALESLRGRSLIEASLTGFTQQPVVMEYITEQLIKPVYLTTGLASGL